MKAKDLAKKLGVSPATISLVLNNKPGISESLRSSLIEKIRELGCEDMLHKSYRVPKNPVNTGGEQPTEPPKVIVYLIYTSCDESNDRFAFYPAVLEGAEMEARDNNYNLVVLHMSCEGNSNLKRLVRSSGNAIGAIVQAARIDDCILEDLSVLDIPYVFVDSYVPHKNVNCVCTNNEQGIFSAVNYLKEKGHTDIGYVYSGHEHDTQVERRRCFHLAMRDCQLEDKRENYFSTGGGLDTTDFEVLKRVFSEREKMPTAIVAENDRLAWRTIKALQRVGYSVPEDISVIGFDDRSICTMIEPNLTSVKTYRSMMGRECVIMLQNIIRLQKLGVSQPFLKYELPTRLIERDSVAEVKK